MFLLLASKKRGYSAYANWMVAIFAPDENPLIYIRSRARIFSICKPFRHFLDFFELPLATQLSASIVVLRMKLMQLLIQYLVHNRSSHLKIDPKNGKSKICSFLTA